jgi:hypothetical protein
LPTISIGTITNTTSCGSSTGQIEVLGSGNGNITWTGTSSGLVTGVDLPFTITGLSAGNYSIEFEVNGCSSLTLSQTIIDPNAPAAPTISVNGDLEICQGEVVELTSSYTIGNVWSNSSTSQTIIVSESGDYSVLYTDLSGCSSASNVISVLVHENPEDATINASGPTYLLRRRRGSFNFFLF